MKFIQEIKTLITHTAPISVDLISVMTNFLDAISLEDLRTKMFAIVGAMSLEFQQRPQAFFSLLIYLFS